MNAYQFRDYFTGLRARLREGDIVDRERVCTPCTNVAYLMRHTGITGTIGVVTMAGASSAP